MARRAPSPPLADVDAGAAAMSASAPPSPSSAPGERSFCAGLVLVASRALSGDEEAALRRERRRLAWCGALAALATLATPLASAVAFVRVLERAGDPVWIAPAVSGWLLVPVVGALVAFKSARRLRSAHAALRARRALRFEGTLASTDRQDAAARALVHQQLLRAREAHAIDLLAGSGRVLAVDGHAPKTPLAIRITTVADPPPGAAIAARWLKPLPGASASTGDGAPPTALLAGQRALGAAELRELGARLADLTRSSVLRVLAPLPWLLFYVAFSGPGGNAGARRFFGVFCIFLGVVAVRAFLHETRILLRLRADVRAARVVILSTAKPLARPDDDAAPAAAPLADAPAIEILPRSRLQWSDRGEPARWRTATRLAP